METRTLLKVTLLCGMSLLPARGQSAEPRLVEVKQEFGLVGLAPGQTARINAVLTDGNGPMETPAEVDLEFRNGDGGVIIPCVKLPLQAGQGVYLDVDHARATVYGEDGTPSSERISLRAVAVLTGPARAIGNPNDKNGRPQLIATVEIFDARYGKTSLVLSPAVTTFRRLAAE